MRLWRVSDHERLDGQGAQRFGGRWTRRGTAVIYMAGTLALAILEILAHSRERDLQRRLVAHYVDVADDIEVEHVDPAQLPADWDAHPSPPELQEIGTRWIIARRSLLLGVPSAVLKIAPDLVPIERNYLLDPAHPMFARVRPRSVTIGFDPRFLV